MTKISYDAKINSKDLGGFFGNTSLEHIDECEKSQMMTSGSLKSISTLTGSQGECQKTAFEEYFGCTQDEIVLTKREVAIWKKRTIN
jgi:hypothetical protein